MSQKPTELKFTKIEIDRSPRRTHVVRLTLVGLKPGLLMNPMDPNTLQSLATGVKPANKPKDRSEQDICEEKVYRDKDGKMCIPQTWVWAALSHAGRSIGYGEGKSKVSTAESTKLPEFLTFNRINFPFEGVDKEGNIPWEPNLMRGVNTATEGATGIVRPLVLPGWKVVIELEFNATRMPLATLVELFSKAGEIAGLGDFRPQKKGPFGTFTVENVEIAPMFDGANALMAKASVKKKVKGKKGDDEGDGSSKETPEVGEGD